MIFILDLLHNNPFYCNYDFATKNYCAVSLFYVQQKTLLRRPFKQLKNQEIHRREPYKTDVCHIEYT